VSKRRKQAEERATKIAGKLCELREAKAKLFQQNNSLNEAQSQAQLLNNEISKLEEQLLKARNVIGTDEIVYGKAKVLITHGKEEAKEVTVIVKNHSIPESFVSSTYIVSQDSQLACAIRKTPVNAVAEYGINGRVTVIRVIEKDF